MQIRFFPSLPQSFQVNTPVRQSASHVLSQISQDQVLFGARKKKADAAKEAAPAAPAPAETPAVSETNKLIYELAIQSFNKELQWEPGGYVVVDGTPLGMEEGETTEGKCIKAKLKDGRTVLVGGDFLDIEGGDGFIFGLQEKSQKKMKPRALSYDEVDGNVTHLFNQAYMMNYSWRSDADIEPDADDLERWNDLLAEVGPEYKTSATQAATPAPAKSPVLSETNKLIYQLAILSFDKALKWKDTEAEVDGSQCGMDEGETLGVNAIQTKLKDGRTVLLGGDFLDISGGVGCAFGLKEKGQKKMVTRTLSSDEIDGNVLELFNHSYMMNYSWVTDPPTEEDLERWSELLANVDPGYKQ